MIIYTIFNTNFLKFFTLRKMCPNLELLFSRIQTEAEEILRIQLECGKILTRKTPNMNTFHTVLFSIFIFLVRRQLFVLIYVLHNDSQ